MDNKCLINYNLLSVDNETGDEVGIGDDVGRANFLGLQRFFAEKVTSRQRTNELFGLSARLFDRNTNLS